MNTCMDVANDLGVKIEGIMYTPMQPGDLYLAQRHGQVKLLTCAHDDRTNGWVLPVELDYPYDTHECFRIIDNQVHNEQ